MSTPIGIKNNTRDPLEIRNWIDRLEYGKQLAELLEILGKRVIRKDLFGSLLLNLRAGLRPRPFFMCAWHGAHP